MAIDFVKLAEELGKSNEKPRINSGEYIKGQGLAGLADTIGGIGDAPARLFQLAKVGPAALLAAPVLSAITGKPKSDFMPEVNIEAANMFTNYLKNLAGVDESAQAPDSLSRYAGAAARGLGGSVLTGGGGTVKELALNALKSGAVGGVAGLGSEAGKDTAEAIGAPPAAGQVVGGLLGGVGAASVGGAAGIALRTKKLMDELQDQAKDPEAMKKAAEAASKIVNAKLKASVSGTPNAAENITEALALRQRIPGFNPSVPEMAGSPGALAMQRAYAANNPQALNEEVARVAASEQALRNHLENVAPPANPQPGSVRSAVNQSLSDEAKRLAAEAQGTAGKLPVADLGGIGGKMAEIAAAEKAAAKPAIDAAYNKAYGLAPEPAIPSAPILSKIEETLGIPLAKIKPETAPNTFAAIKRFLGGEGKTPEELNYLSSVLGGNIENQGSKQAMTLAEAHALRKAVGADAALASRSADPLAASRLRNIGGLKNSIDEAIAGSPISQEAKDAFAAANAKYQNEYAPRFKEGVNARVFKATSDNEPRILADKFIGEFFKPDQQGGGTRAENFKQLFGANQEARTLTKEGILDRFRNDVMNHETGVLDATKAANFMRQYGRTLEAYKNNGVNALDDIKSFAATAAKQEQAASKLKSLSSSLKFDNVDDLANAALGNRAVMGNVIGRINPEMRDSFVRMVMDKAASAKSGSELNAFLDKNADSLKLLLKPEHESALRDIAKGMSIIEQSPIKGLAGQQTTDPLKAATGVSMATVWSQWRAMTGGRQGVATMGFNLATPVFTKLSQTRFDDVMKTALHDPKTAENLRNMLQANTQAAATNWAERLMESLKTAGSVTKAALPSLIEVASGKSNWNANLKRTIPAINASVQSGGEE